MKGFFAAIGRFTKRAFRWAFGALQIADDVVDYVAAQINILAPRAIPYIEMMAPYTQTDVDDKIAAKYREFNLDEYFNPTKTANELKFDFVRLMLTYVDPLPGTRVDNDLIDAAVQNAFTIWKRRQDQQPPAPAPQA